MSSKKIDFKSRVTIQFPQAKFDLDYLFDPFRKIPLLKYSFPDPFTQINPETTTSDCSLPSLDFFLELFLGLSKEPR